MNPFTIATIVATLMATKALERVGETIGERGIIEGTKRWICLVGSLRRL